LSAGGRESCQSVPRSSRPKKPYEKTHDIEVLVDARGGEIDFQLSVSWPTPPMAGLPTPRGFVIRTPPLPSNHSRTEYDEALKYAQSIYDFVLNLLPAEARP